MKTAIVILNWNGRKFLEKYLPVLIGETPKDTKIVIADNGSQDGSTDWIENFLVPRYKSNLKNEEQFEYFDEEHESARIGHGIYNYSTKNDTYQFNIDNLEILKFNSNLGFTQGYNAALEKIEAEYYVIMNSDIRVPEYSNLLSLTQGFKENWLTPLTYFLDTHPQAGICMPKIVSEIEYSENSRQVFEYAGASGGFIDRYGFPFCRGRILSSVENDTGQYNNPIQIFWASGACMVIRSSLFKVLGGFDVNFFAHMEEIDLCWRAKLLGWQVWAIPQSKVYHIGGGTLPNNSPKKLYLNYRNNLLMLYKNLPLKEEGWEAFGIKGKYNRETHILIRKIIDGLSAVAYLLKGKFSYAKAVTRAHKDFRQMKKSMEPSPRIKEQNLTGIYKGSIIKAFLLYVRRFSDLDLS